jgi:hypothetical protein
VKQLILVTFESISAIEHINGRITTSISLQFDINKFIRWNP